MYLWNSLKDWSHRPVTEEAVVSGAVVVVDPHGGLLTALLALLREVNRSAWHRRGMAPVVSVGFVISTSIYCTKSKINVSTCSHMVITRHKVTNRHWYMYFNHIIYEILAEERKHNIWVLLKWKSFSSYCILKH